MNTNVKIKLNRKDQNLEQKLPIKVVQFGGGNFLRAFSDYVVDLLNENEGFNAGIAHVKVTPSKGNFEAFLTQDNLYTVFIRGLKNGNNVDDKRLISCIQKSVNPYSDYQDYLDLAKETELKFVFSNTTEAGIVFDENILNYNDKTPNNFPAKLTALLFERFKFFNGDLSKGLIIIPCELIENNANTLKKYIKQYAELWQLDTAFTKWLDEANSFHNTLVDRIVPGYPKGDEAFYQDQLNYQDDLMVVAESFLLWVIEGNKELLQQIPFDKLDEKIIIVDDIAPYRNLKVKILNGAHTAMVPIALLADLEIVKEAVENEFVGNVIHKLVKEEILATIDMPKNELDQFVADVFERFRNPYLKHYLSSIALNSISKFTVRVLPSLISYQEKKGKLPANICFALAALIVFYKGNKNGKKLPVKDDINIIETFNNYWINNDYTSISKLVLSHKDLWQADLTQIPELEYDIASLIEKIDTLGVIEAYKLVKTK